MASVIDIYKSKHTGKTIDDAVDRVPEMLEAYKNLQEIIAKYIDHVEFDVNGDYGIVYGETKHIVAKVMSGYGGDVTSNYGRWSIVRDTGDEIEDKVWNYSEKAKSFNGTIDISYTAECNDVGAGLSAKFTVTCYRLTDGTVTTGVLMI